jgi:hypothetical protein
MGGECDKYDGEEKYIGFRLRNLRRQLEALHAVGRIFK